jgi:hypothetical protein
LRSHRGIGSRAYAGEKTFHSTREAFISVGTKYRVPSLDAYCDSLIREQENLLHLGLVKTDNSSNKALVA